MRVRAEPNVGSFQARAPQGGQSACNHSTDPTLETGGFMGEGALNPGGKAGRPGAPTRESSAAPSVC